MHQDQQYEVCRRQRFIGSTGCPSEHPAKQDEFKLSIMNKYVWLLAFVLALCNCKKVDNLPQLPPVTHTGVNVLACKINGNVFIVSNNQTGCLFCPKYGVSFIIYNTGLISIDALNQQPRFEISINIPASDTISGNYQIPFTYPYFAGFSNYDGDPISAGSYNIDSANNGKITILYYDGNILAGTFAFDAVNSSGQVVHITEGRFDIANH